MGDARTAARLLLADDPAEAEPLAARLEAANRTRRRADGDGRWPRPRRRPAAAPGAARPSSWPATGRSASSASWPASGRGAAAARPSSSPRAVEPWRGSARIAGGFDLAAAFEACCGALRAPRRPPRAAGCELRPGAFDAFRARFLALAGGAPRRRRARARARPRRRRPSMSTTDCSASWPRSILLGPGDAAARSSASRGLVVGRARPATGGHAQLTLRKGREVLDGDRLRPPRPRRDRAGDARSTSWRTSAAARSAASSRCSWRS